MEFSIIVLPYVSKDDGELIDDKSPVTDRLVYF